MNSSTRPRRPAPTRGTLLIVEGGEITGLLVVATLCLWNPWGYSAVPSLPTLAAALIGAAIVIRGLARGVIVWHRAATWVAVTLGGWLIAALLSSAPLLGLFGAMGRSNGVISIGLRLVALLAGLSLGLQPARRPGVVRGLVFGSWLLAALTLAGRFGVPVVPAPGGPRATGPLGSAAFTGAALAVLLPLSAAVLDRPLGRFSGRHWRLLVGSGVALQLLALLATGARAAWIGAVVAAGLLAARFRRTVPRRTLVLSAATVVAAGAVAFVALGLQTRIADLGDTSGGRAGRMAVWSGGARAAATVPLLGVGPDQQQRVLSRHLADDFERFFDDAVVADRAHNEILDSLLATGLVGTVPLIASWLVVGRGVWRSRDNTTTVALGAALVAYGVHLGFNFAAPQLELLVWAIAGLAVGPQARAVTPPIQPLIPAVLASGVIVFPLALDVAADHSLARGVAAEQAGDLPAAAAHYSVADGWASWQPLPAEVRARFALRGGDAPSAITAAVAARQRSGDDPRWVELHAQALLAANQPAEAAGLLEQLIDDDDHNSSLYEGLGYAYRSLGRTNDARESFYRALTINPRRESSTIAIESLSTT